MYDWLKFPACATLKYDIVIIAALPLANARFIALSYAISLAKALM
jgi:hypothetical protein